ncbi:hypothetical protein DNTS_000056 [Danionella cerebrum]|uniref:Uncharacterized protein n=1 Tax=Danionella cerebrum TaxID=2873325 RepID=A0A553PXF1_9TELE|nr:hypothetical protein DNTS_000056 [Danionella translucida]
MKAKQCVTGSLRRRVCVSLNPPGVKSSVKKAPRRRALCGLVQKPASDLSMAGDSGEADRLPKRRFHGELEESFGAAMSENVKTKHEKKASCEPRGKENSAAKCSVDAKMEETVHSLQTNNDPSIFFDEDSNHVFPVEQFFGNLDDTQEYPRRTPGSKKMNRREYRSMHYYAKEESEDEDQTSFSELICQLAE